MKKDYFVVSSLSAIEADGKIVAFVKGNRYLNARNVNTKKQSLKKFECNLSPVMYVSGERAFDDGCILVNPVTLKPFDIKTSEDAKKYIVIVDGQHRYKATLDGEIDHESLILMEVFNDKANTKDLLSTMNIDSMSWSPKDYVNGADLFRHNDLTDYCRILSNRGYSISTIGMFLSFQNQKLTKKILSRYMTDMEYEIPFDYDLDRAWNLTNAIIEAHLDDSFASKRYLIEVVSSLSQKYTDSKVIAALKRMNPDTAAKLNSLRGVDEIAVKDILKQALLEILDSESNAA